MVNWSKGMIAVEGLDDPVAIGPDLAIVVDVDAVRVAVAGDVEPVARAMLTVVGRGEVAVDHVLVGVGRGVLEEGVELGGSRREAGEVERDAADEGAAVGGGGGSEGLGFELGRG